MVALRISFLPESSGSEEIYSRGSNAIDLADRSHLILRFAIEAEDPEDLEALRHARRSMLREEWTRGREENEPSLEDAVFSTADISWRIRQEHRRWCLKKVEELATRANRSWLEMKTR